MLIYLVLICLIPLTILTVLYFDGRQTVCRKAHPKSVQPKPLGKEEANIYIMRNGVWKSFEENKICSIIYLYTIVILLFVLQNVTVTNLREAGYYECNDVIHMTLLWVTLCSKQVYCLVVCTLSCSLILILTQQICEKNIYYLLDKGNNDCLILCQRTKRFSGYF